MSGLDRDIMTLSAGGIYSTANHLAELKQSGHGDPRAALDVHVRRLEALRRVGVVERVADGVWMRCRLGSMSLRDIFWLPCVTVNWRWQANGCRTN